MTSFFSLLSLSQFCIWGVAGNHVSSWRSAPLLVNVFKSFTFGLLENESEVLLNKFLLYKKISIHGNNFHFLY